MSTTSSTAAVLNRPDDFDADQPDLQDFSCGIPNGKEILWLHKQGVCMATMTRPWIVGAESVCFSGSNFDFDARGERALIFRAEDRGITTDLIAWSAREDKLASWRGSAVALGDVDLIWTDDCLRVHRSPLQWLQNNRDEIVIVDPARAYAYLRDVPAVLSSDADLLRDLHAWTRAPETKINFLLEVGGSMSNSKVVKIDFRPDGTIVGQEPRSTPNKYGLTSIADVPPKAVDWTWPGYLAKGKLTLLGGDPDLGKSLVCIAAAATLSKGRKWPGGGLAKTGATIFICSEDGVADTIRPRAEAAEADLRLLHVFESTLIKDGNRKSFNLRDDLDMLGAAIESVEDVSLVVVDAITHTWARSTATAQRTCGQCSNQ